MRRKSIRKSKVRAHSTTADKTPATRCGIVTASGKRAFDADAQGASLFGAWLTKQKGNVKLRFLKLEMWPSEFSWPVLTALSNLNGKYIAIGQRDPKHQTCFNAVLAAILPRQSEKEYERIVTIANEALALECPVEGVAEAVNRLLVKCKKVGYKPPAANKLKRSITKLAQQSRGLPSSDPQYTAQLYLRSLRDGSSNHALRLVLHRDDWHRFSHIGWEKTSAKEVHIQLTRWLQHTGQGPEITQRYSGDVFHNLQAMCSVFSSTQEQPIWLNDAGEATTSPYLATSNCLLDMRKVLRGKDVPSSIPLTPHHFSVQRLNVAYDPDARCPGFIKAVTQILKPIEKRDRRINVLQEFAGWMLDGGKLRLEKFLVLFGTGSNGKSVLLTLIKEVLGATNVSSVPLHQLNHEFRLTEMIGKIANITNEMPRVESFEEGTLKQIVSGDPIQINRKYKDPISCIPSAKLAFATNSLPQVADRTESYFRRVIAIPFFNVFDGESKDIGLLTRLRDELPGILNWMIAGLARLARNHEFTHCTVCANTLRAYQHDSDPFRQFIEECCILKQGATTEEGSAYRRYEWWCKEVGRKSHNKTNFIEAICRIEGISKVRPGRRASSRTRMIKGIEIRKEHYE